MITVFDEMDAPNINGTGLAGHVNATYNQLVDVLGKPTFDEPSGDGKVQVEWVVKFKDDIFTIYDWKTYDRDYTLNNLNRFNVGSKVNAFWFIVYLEKFVYSSIIRK